jgi:glycerol uptake facilitator protein
VAIIWGLGIATAIYLTGALSGAHLNPAVTLAVVVFRGMPLQRLPLYWFAQCLGAFVGAAILYLCFSEALTSYEKDHQIIRGDVGSEASAMVFGEYFPNPGGKALSEHAEPDISSWRAFGVESLGTAILVLVIFGVTDDRNPEKPRTMVGATIGLTITMLISLFGPLTMAGFNPARDFGPRLFSSLVGWGKIPFTTNGWGWLTVYVLAPLTGALFGGVIYSIFLKPYYLATRNR